MGEFFSDVLKGAFGIILALVILILIGLTVYNTWMVNHHQAVIEDIAEVTSQLVEAVNQHNEALNNLDEYFENELEEYIRQLVIQAILANIQ